MVVRVYWKRPEYPEETDNLWQVTDFPTCIMQSLETDDCEHRWLLSHFICQLGREQKKASHSDQLESC